MQEKKMAVEFMDKRRQIFREMVCNEEALVNRRLTWLLTGQAFLFAGLFAGMQQGQNGKINILFYAVSFFGYPFSILIFSSLIANVKAFEKIALAWKKVKPNSYDGPDIFGLAPIFGEGYAGINPYMSSENVIALLSSGFWLYFSLFMIWKAAYPISFAAVMLVVFAIFSFSVLFFWLGRDKESKNIKLEKQKTVVRVIIMGVMILSFIFSSVCCYVQNIS